MRDRKEAWLIVALVGVIVAQGTLTIWSFVR
jgi:hypothetical protein